MSFPDLPVADVPAAAAFPAAPLPGNEAAGKNAPLAARLTFRLTISAKINYYDLTGATMPPFGLREAVILLCLCAHDNAPWYEPRTAEHRDGEDDPPVALAFSLVDWHRYIRDWADQHLSPFEEEAIVSTALRVWDHGHATAVEPQPPEDSGSKKKAAASPTGLSSTSLRSVELASGETISFTASPSGPPTPSSTPSSAPPATSA